jgi:hypothetical protein
MRLKIIIIIVVTSLIIVATYYRDVFIGVDPEHADPNEGNRSYLVARRDIRHYLTFSEQLEAVKSYSISVPDVRYGASLAEILPDRSEVKKDQIVARLSNVKYKSEEQTIELSIKDSETQLAEAQEGLRLADVQNRATISTNSLALLRATKALSKYVDEESRQQLRQLQSDTVKIQQDIDANNKVYNDLKRKWFSERDKDARNEMFAQMGQQQNFIERNIAEHRKITYQLKSFKTYDRPEKIAQLGDEVNKATLALNSSISQARSAKNTNLGKIDALKHKLSKMGEQKDALNKQIISLDIKSPVDGTFYWRERRMYSNEVEIAVGAELYPSQAIAEIPDVSSYKVVLRVPESFKGLIKVGNRAIIRPAINPGVSLPGKIIDISATPSRRHEWDTSSPLCFKVTVTSDKTEKIEGFTPKMSMNVDLIIDEIKSALALPVEAVEAKNGGHWCRVLVEGPKPRWEDRKLKIGVITSDCVEILSGIKEGDKVSLQGAQP